MTSSRMATPHQRETSHQLAGGGRPPGVFMYGGGRPVAPLRRMPRVALNGTQWWARLSVAFFCSLPRWTDADPEQVPLTSLYCSCSHSSARIGAKALPPLVISHRASERLRCAAGVMAVPRLLFGAVAIAIVFSARWASRGPMRAEPCKSVTARAAGHRLPADWGRRPLIFAVARPRLISIWMMCRTS